jgi:hypothetical protein
MKVYASCSERTFFVEGFYTALPADAVEISTALHEELYSAPSKGLTIDFTTSPPSLKARHVVADPVNERAWRDSEMVRAGGVRDRHRDEQELFRPTTLTPERFVELLGYIQKLRDWPQSAAFPDTTQRPVAPTWLTEHQL